MPLIGLVDPTHNERSKSGSGRYPAWLTLQEVLDQSAVAAPKWSPWNNELIQAVVGGHQERGARLSVTALTGGCMRGNIIERKEDYIGSLDSMYAAFRGTMVHMVLESFARPGSLAEWRFYTEVDGQEISGSPDLITYDTVWDWKTTENPPAYSYMWDDHKLQLNFNRFCFNNATKWDAPDGQDPGNIPLDPHNTRIGHLAIVYLGPKGPKVIETETSIQVPNRTRPGMHKKNIPEVWSDEQVLAELRPRMQAWESAWNTYPNWPVGLEDYPGWAGPPDWKCPGVPLCYLPGCMAKRWEATPDANGHRGGLTWESG